MACEGESVSFTSLLSRQDRNRLRSIVRKTHSMYMKPGTMAVSDHDCDQLIDAMAPDVAQGMVKEAMDTGGID